MLHDIGCVTRARSKIQNDSLLNLMTSHGRKSESLESRRLISEIFDMDYTQYLNVTSVCSLAILAHQMQFICKHLILFYQKGYDHAVCV